MGSIDGMLEVGGTQWLEWDWWVGLGFDRRWGSGVCEVGLDVCRGQRETAEQPKLTV